MGFFKNIRFWKRRRYVITKEVATSTDHVTTETTGTQFDSSMDGETTNNTSELADMEKLLQQKDDRIQKLQATIGYMEEEHRKEVQFIISSSGLQNRSRLRRIAILEEEIRSLKQHGPQRSARVTEYHWPDRSMDLRIVLVRRRRERMK
jgi:septal ring factor EnvC (AmiA/AmiB activator)